MMKKIIAAALIAVMTAGVFTGCGMSGGKDIGKDAALEAALDDAGVKESDTTRLRVSQEQDDGRKVYEIRFDAAGVEYEYEIQASDGMILSADSENIGNGNSAQTGGNGTQNNAQENQNAQNNNDTQNQQNNGNNNTAPGANVAISQEEAAAIALERVPGATDNDIRIELDHDDGVYRYEGDIIYEQKEYDFEIDANTGTVLEWSEERY